MHRAGPRTRRREPRAARHHRAPVHGCAGGGSARGRSAHRRRPGPRRSHRCCWLRRCGRGSRQRECRCNHGGRGGKRRRNRHSWRPRDTRRRRSADQGGRARCGGARRRRADRRWRELHRQPLPWRRPCRCSGHRRRRVAAGRGARGGCGIGDRFRCRLKCRRRLRDRRGRASGQNPWLRERVRRQHGCDVLGAGQRLAFLGCAGDGVRSEHRKRHGSDHARDRGRLRRDER